MTFPSNTPLAEAFGTIIREDRIRQGLGQAELSLVSGVSVPTISDIENAKRDTRLSSYQRLLDALGFDAGRLLSRTEPDRQFLPDEPDGHDREVGP